MVRTRRQTSQASSSQPQVQPQSYQHNRPNAPNMLSTEFQSNVMHQGTKGSIDSSNIERRVRGPTRLPDIWNLPEGKRITIELNHLGQPVKKKSGKLTRFLGMLARNGSLAPLTYKNWRKMKQSHKTEMWQLVEKKFDVAPHGKFWVMSSLSKKWRSWKCELRAKYFDPDDVPRSFKNIPNRVIQEQWHSLVLYWDSEEGRKASKTYKKNREKQKFPHTTGTKSFAQIREEEREKRPYRSYPSRAEMFVKVHRPKPGKVMDEETSEAISKISDLQYLVEGQDSEGDDDILSKVIGKDPNGHVRTYGLGPKHTDLWRNGQKNASGDEGSNNVTSVNEENKLLRIKLDIMEQNYARMEAKLDKVMERLISATM